MHPNNKEIQSLEQRISDLKSKQQSCRHQWGEPFYNPEPKQEPYGYEFKTQGSDSWYAPSGYHTVYHPRWTRECTLCGFQEHTKNTEPVSTDTKPKFQ
jgi:hypothetical protein